MVVKGFRISLPRLNYHTSILILKLQLQRYDTAVGLGPLANVDRVLFVRDTRETFLLTFGSRNIPNLRWLDEIVERGECANANHGQWEGNEHIRMRN